MSAQERTTYPVDPGKVKEEDVMKFSYYAKVNINGIGDDKLHVTDLDNGNLFTVEGRELTARAHSADYYAEELKVTKTEMVDLLLDSWYRPFTVDFVRKDGKPRTLRGRLVGLNERNQGYADVEDLDLPVSNRFRQVDLRTLSTLIVDGVRYILKK